MPTSPAPSPAAYTATITPFDLNSGPMRLIRISARQHAALDGLQVTVVIDAESPFVATTQAELAVQDAAARILRGRGLSAALWQDINLGDLAVWHDGAFLPIATVELTRARQQAGVAA